MLVLYPNLPLPIVNRNKQTGAKRHAQKQTREHDVRGEDKDVHDREEELKRMLKEAEQRCQDLREGLERARALSGRQESMSTGPPSPDSLSVEPAVLEGMGLAPLSAKVRGSSPALFDA